MSNQKDYRNELINVLGEQEGNQCYELFVSLPSELREEVIHQMREQLNIQREMLAEVEDIRLQVDELKRNNQGEK
jgi:flagellar motor switch protein FliG